ncbi:hypothetical protein QFC22_004031 [Naganishia vaughanmartiniae]|uniref:Uncharacterized protein n=1 Tax=Naganishia vaughanmartiniae TaxID=1424756 RepID=A0ACC2X3Y5_9TREE|nr:hypothetical protein QFC22_004031 [Naganishia vaughanmartiniae]
MTSLQPRASTRISIQWEGEPATEATDTLVLTYPGLYLDLRVYREGHPSEGSIQWAQAGIVDEAEEDTDGLPSLTFVPTISSVAPPPLDVKVLPDQGTFKTMPNGDVEEYGTMFNPDTGRNQGYIEVWRRLSLQSPSSTNKYSKDDTTSLLLEQTPSSHWPRAQSFLGHIGQYGLGISRVKDTVDSDPRFLAWREVFDFEKAVWERTHTVGDREEVDLYLPSLNSVPQREDLPRGGETVSVANGDWILKRR